MNENEVTALVQTDKKQKLSLEERLAIQLERTKKLERRVNEKRRQEAQKNLAAIFDLIKAHGLDKLPIEKWTTKLLDIKKALE